MTQVVNKKYQEYDVFIGRPSKWGNPFMIGPHGGREMVIKKYEEWIRTQPHLMSSIPELRGKRLGCFCHPEACHGDVLVKLVKEFEMKSARERLEAGVKAAGKCTRCRLSKTRTNVVFGEGSPKADVMFVGEAPGKEEDEQGRPFVGRSGKMLNTWIEKGLGLKREDVYIANTVKCRPNDNRDPAADEMRTCRPFLDKQIEIVQPKVIVTLGRIAAKSLLGVKDFYITREHGVWKKYNDIDLICVYHPAFLLRQGSKANKKAVQDDFKLISDKIKSRKVKADVV